MNNTFMKKVLFVKREHGTITVYSMNTHSEEAPLEYYKTELGSLKTDFIS